MARVWSGASGGGGNVVGNAPVDLDTLEEIAAAIENNPDFGGDTQQVLNFLASGLTSLGNANNALDTRLDALEGSSSKERHEVVVPLRYFDSSGFGNDFNSASVGLLFDGDASPDIPNPLAGKDVIVSASVFLPTFRVFTENVDQHSPVGRSADLGIMVDGVVKNHRSWQKSIGVLTPDRLPLLPDPLQSNPTNGLGGYTISNSVEIEDSDSILTIYFNDYLNTDPGLPWTLFGYRVPEYMEGIDHARLLVTIQEK